MLEIQNYDLIKIPGWLTKQDSMALFKLTSQYNRPDAVGVEIGSLFGRSSHIISTAISLGSLHCIDLWDGRTCFNDSISENIIKDNNYPTQEMFNTLEFFLENVKDRTNISTIQGDSPECVQGWDKMVDFVFLDASHINPGDINNINFWLPKIKSGGLFIGHDADLPDVIENIRYLEKLLDQTVTIIPGTLVYYFKINTKITNS